MKPNACLILKTALSLIVATFASSSAFAAPRAAERQAATEGGAIVSLPASVLHVTGTTNSFTVSAQHADVLSILKLVFEQSHKQFVPDASVTGDVTFALSGQRFDVVLSAICRQTFLRYEIDRNGIYQFRRDEEALRSLLRKTQAINSQLQDQLRHMGYSLSSSPGGGEDGRNRGLRGGQQFGEGDGTKGANGGFGGSFGGGDAIGRSRSANMSTRSLAPGANADASTAAKKADVQPRATQEEGRDSKDKEAVGPERRINAPAPISPAGPRGEALPRGREGRALPNAGSLPADRAAPRSGNGSLQLDARALGMMPNLEDEAQRRLFLKQNNFVSINTQGELAPVRDILADIGKQANVPILIDPGVPKGEEFVVNATIPPRPLNEMLNILGYYARLEWHWVNGRIYITTTPQLQMYLRGSPLPGPTNVGGGITVLPQNRSQTSPLPKKSEGTEKTTDGDKGN